MILFSSHLLHCCAQFDNIKCFAIISKYIHCSWIESLSWNLSFISLSKFQTCRHLDEKLHSLLTISTRNTCQGIVYLIPSNEYTPCRLRSIIGSCIVEQYCYTVNCEPAFFTLLHIQTFCLQGMMKTCHERRKLGEKS